MIDARGRIAERVKNAYAAGYNDDRKKLLASVDMMSEELKGLRGQVSLYIAREAEAEIVASESRKMINQCYAKIREIEPRLDQVVAELSGREVKEIVGADDDGGGGSDGYQYRVFAKTQRSR